MDSPILDPKISKKRNSTIYLAILVVVLAAIAVGVIYAIAKNETASNTNIPTNAVANTNTSNVNLTTSKIAGWSDYSDAASEYTISFPANWVIRKSTDNTGASIVELASDQAHLALESSQIAADGFRVRLFEEKGLGQNKDANTALKSESGREALPLKQESFLTVNGLPAYRAYRELKKGERDPYGNAVTSSVTAVEFTYLSNDNLFRFWATIYGESPASYTEQIDSVAKTFTIKSTSSNTNK